MAAVAAAPSLVADRPLEADLKVAGEEGQSQSKKKLVAIVLVAVLAAGGAFTFMKGGSAEADTTPAAPVAGEVVDVAQMTVNLANAESRFARLSFSVVLPEGVVKEAVAPNFPLLQEAVLREVSQFDAGMLRAAGGFDALAEALTARAHEVYPDGEVLRVVLTELLVQ